MVSPLVSERTQLALSFRELPVSHDAVALAQRHWTRVLR
jgi:hypothetical protein